MLSRNNSCNDYRERICWENHQFKNAQSLVNKKAALIVEDIEANRKLVDTILKLVNDEGLQKKISKNIKKLEIKDASVRISEVAMKLLKWLI